MTNKVKFALIAASFISFVLISALIRGGAVHGAIMEKEDPKVIFDRIVANLAKDTEMLKEIRCHYEDEIKFKYKFFETCFAYKWFAPAFQRYAEKVLKDDLSDLVSSHNDYGTPSVTYNLSKNLDYDLHFIYRNVETSDFLKEFDDLKGYKGQIVVIVGEK
jgi:hypothetical protein